MCIGTAPLQLPKIVTENPSVNHIGGLPATNYVEHLIEYARNVYFDNVNIFWVAR